MSTIKFYLSIGVVIAISSIIIYGLLKINSLTKEIHNLEKDLMVMNVQKLTAEENVTKLKRSIEEQNKAISSLNYNYQKALIEIKEWKAKSNKYSKELSSILNKNDNSCESIIEKLNGVSKLRYNDF